MVYFKLGSGLSVTIQMFVPFQGREEVSGGGERGICHQQVCAHP